MINSRTQGSAHIVIIVSLAIVIIGALGYVFWQNLGQSDEIEDDNKVAQKITTQESAAFCANESDGVEVDGIFCSQETGVEFKVPEIFKDKLKKAENYSITGGSMESFQGNPAGKSTVNYEAVVASGEETLSLTIAREPLRSGYSSVGHALRRTYFNAETKNLHFVEGAMSEYDSSTNTYKVTQEGYAGESLPFFEVNGIKVFHGNVGDAGVIERGYLAVMKNHLVVIKIKHAINPMNERAIDIDRPFTDLDSHLRELKVLS